MKIIISFGIFLIFTTTATCNLKVENEDRVIGKFKIVDLPNMFLILSKVQFKGGKTRESANRVWNRV